MEIKKSEVTPEAWIALLEAGHISKAYWGRITSVRVSRVQLSPTQHRELIGGKEYLS